MDFDPLEHAVNGVWVLSSEFFGLFKRVCFDNDETTGFVGERPGEHDPASLVERFHVRQMSRTVDFSFRFAVRTVESDDDEFHPGM